MSSFSTGLHSAEEKVYLAFRQTNYGGWKNQSSSYSQLGAFCSPFSLAASKESFFQYGDTKTLRSTTDEKTTTKRMIPSGAP